MFSNPILVVLTFFISLIPLYPLAKFFFPHIKNPNTAAIIHIIYGLIISIVMFGSDTFYVILMLLSTYLSLKYASAKVSIGISIVILYSIHYIIYLRKDDWALDMSSIIMVVFQKVWSLAFNLEDGKVIKKKKTTGRERWDSVAILEMPSFLFYSAYLLTPYGSFCDPFIEYKLFELILNRGLRKDEDISKEDHHKAMTRFFGSFLWAGFVYFSFRYVSYDSYKSDWYLSLPLFVKVFVLPTLTVCQASRYFPAWWLVEAGFYEFGLSSANIVPANDLTNMSMLDVCLSPSCEEFMRRWNHTTHIFWKNYLFTRLLSWGYPKYPCSIFVDVCSMLWHGFKFIYLGMLPETFLLSFVDTMVHKRWPLTDKSPFWKKAYHIMWVYVSMLYTTSTWFFPSFEQYYYVRSTVYFLPSVISIIEWILLTIFSPRHKKPVKQL